MAGLSFLRWIDGNGWLVFAGGATKEGDVRARALARLDAGGAVAYISLANDGGDALLDDMEDLGAPTGFILDVLHEPSGVVEEQLKSVAMVVIEGATSIDSLYRALSESVIEAIRAAYERGALILLEGLAINLFGTWLMSDDGVIYEGLGWVHEAFLEPNVTSAQDSRAVQDVLMSQPKAIAIAIGESSALALGGDGTLEVWGDKQVTISLGGYYQN